jgi:hypothetical protein
MKLLATGASDDRKEGITFPMANTLSTDIARHLDSAYKTGAPSITYTKP